MVKIESGQWCWVDGLRESFSRVWHREQLMMMMKMRVAVAQDRSTHKRQQCDDSHPETNREPWDGNDGEAHWEFKERRVGGFMKGSSRCPGSDQWKRWKIISRTPYLGRQRPHPAGCRPRWCGSPWWRRLHPAAPRRCWRWRCCCSCSCSNLCGTAAPTPFSNAPGPWVIRRGVVELYILCLIKESTWWSEAMRGTGEQGGMLEGK